MGISGEEGKGLCENEISVGVVGDAGTSSTMEDGGPIFNVN
jgi:hypothetical protein